MLGISTNWQEITALLIAALAAIYLTRQFFWTKRKQKDAPAAASHSVEIGSRLSRGLRRARRRKP